MGSGAALPPPDTSRRNQLTIREDIISRIRTTGADSVAVLKASVDAAVEAITDASLAIVASLKSGGKVLICGNGGSAADAQHMAAELVGRFLLDRAPYAAVALTTDTSVLTALTNDFGADCIFEKQVQALGRAGDVFIGISTSGNSRNVLAAITAAKQAGMVTIAMTGCGGGRLKFLSDILIDAASDHTPRIQETHAFFVHTICEIVEQAMAVT